MNISVWLTHPSIDCWNFSEENLTLLKKLLPEAKITVSSTEEEFVSTLNEAEVVIVWRFKQEWLKLAPKLKILATPAAGRDYFTITPPECLKMCYGSFHGEIMAETVIGYILASCRGVLLSERLKNKYAWPREKMNTNMRTLRGSTVTILGLGNIGMWVARYAKTFGAHVLCIKRTICDKPEFFDDNDRILTTSSLSEVLPQTDHLVCVLPGGRETDNFIGDKELSLLPQTAYIYNVGRGNAIDEAALKAALDSGGIAGACLDVFATEPLQEDSPLRQCENLLIMPHASAVSPQYLELYIREFASHLLKTY